MAKKGKFKKRIAHAAIPIRSGRDVRVPDMPIGLQPSWRFSTVDKGGAYAWPIGKPEELKIVGKLHSFDSMLWSQIEGNDHHHLSSESLSSEALKRLKTIGKDDEVDLLFSFHLGGKSRIVCIRDRNIAKLLWFDPEHKVCPPKK